MIVTQLDRELKACRHALPSKSNVPHQNGVGGSSLSIPDYMNSLKPVFAVLDSLLKLEALCSHQDEFEQLQVSAFTHFNTHHIEYLVNGPEKVIPRLT